MGTVSENRENFMTKKPAKVVKKKVENIHSIYNQEFRYPSLIDRIKILISQVIL